jgi:hypothetical protein
MSVYRRASDGKWVGTLDLGRDANGKRRRHVVYGQLRREVIAKLDETRRRLAAEEPVKDARVTVAMFVDDWIRKALPASGRKAATQENYSTIARTHLAPPPFGVLTLDKLRPSDIEALLVAKRDAGLSDSTVRLIYTVCRAVLDIAVRDGLVRRNVAAAVRRPTIKRTEARYLTASEAGRLLEASKITGCNPSSCSCSAAAYAAVRRSPCTGVTWIWWLGMCGCGGRSPVSTDSWCSMSRKPNGLDGSCRCRRQWWKRCAGIRQRWLLSSSRRPPGCHGLTMRTWCSRRT